MQSIVAQKGNEKMVKCNVFLCFWHGIQFKTTNHSGHCSLVDINWSFFPTSNSDPLSFLPLHIENLHTAKIQGHKVRYCWILFFQHEKCIQLNHKLSLPLIFQALHFHINLSSYSKLGTSHNNQLTMGTPHNKTNAEWCSTQQSTGSDCICFCFFQLKVFVQ
jgi:hypothetical protein